LRIDGHVRTSGSSVFALERVGRDVVARSAASREVVAFLVSSAAVCLAIVLLPLAAPAQARTGLDWSNRPEIEVVAQSEEGRTIIARRIGPVDAATSLVVIGQVHGNEPAGVRVVRELVDRAARAESLDATTTARTTATIWVIDSLNPDGRRAGTRVNANGVDLNRNFPHAWQPSGRGTRQWSGPGAASEMEVQGLMAFLAKVRPTAVLVMHQDFAVVDTTHDRSRRAGVRLAELLGLPARPVGCPGPCRGTLTGWVDQELGAIAITVELPGKVSGSQVRRYADGIEGFTSWLARPESR
jgi:protein MpaA